MLLLPTDLRDRVQDGHPVHHLCDLVDSPDSRLCDARHEGDGRGNAQYEGINEGPSN